MPDACDCGSDRPTARCPILERAVAIWPDYARAWQLLAEAYAAQGDVAAAEEAKRKEQAATSRAVARTSRYNRGSLLLAVSST
jgi:predicted Zn-dependent protease